MPITMTAVMVPRSESDEVSPSGCESGDTLDTEFGVNLSVMEGSFTGMSHRLPCIAHHHREACTAACRRDHPGNWLWISRSATLELLKAVRS